MNIIFLDIDGVLNYLNFFKEQNNTRINYNKHLKDDKYILINKLLQIDFNKLYLLKELCQVTKSYIVITSSWRILELYPLIEEYLTKFGLPIIDVTDNLNGGERGKEIKKYLHKHHKINNYIILDDDIFPDFDEELLFHLIHTNFYNEGFDDDNYYDAVYKLGNKKI